MTTLTALLASTITSPRVLRHAPARTAEPLLLSFRHEHLGRDADLSAWRGKRSANQRPGRPRTGPGVPGQLTTVTPRQHRYSDSLSPKRSPVAYTSSLVMKD